MSNWGKIAIGCRIGKYPDPAFLQSWGQLCAAGLKTDDIVLMNPVAIPHTNAANFLYARMKASKADSLLMVDDDMHFSEDALAVMRESGPEFGILSALTVCRRWPHLPVILKEGSPHPITIKPAKGVVECDYVGLAFTLIRREVLEGLEKANGGNPFIFTNERGEDGELCYQARQSKFRVGVNCDVSIGHRVTVTMRYDMTIGQTVVDSDNFGLGNNGTAKIEEETGG